MDKTVIETTVYLADGVKMLACS